MIIKVTILIMCGTFILGMAVAGITAGLGAVISSISNHHGNPKEK